jgi:hypothetical protein
MKNKVDVGLTKNNNEFTGVLGLGVVREINTISIVVLIWMVRNLLVRRLDYWIVIIYGLTWWILLTIH